MFNLQSLSIAGHCTDVSIVTGVGAVTELVNKGRAFEALKVIRSMLPIEDRLIELAHGAASPAVFPKSAPASMGDTLVSLPQAARERAKDHAGRKAVA
jgi:flagellar biosynthesis regulator FlbT